ncbi:MAG: hypothetical protein M1504_03450 [Candidatus Marsarchaeota archaeon]|nr:hypothetical protein [Candidatus Marsarchaeota archaeon]
MAIIKKVELQREQQNEQPKEQKTEHSTSTEHVQHQPHEVKHEHPATTQQHHEKGTWMKTIKSNYRPYAILFVIYLILALIVSYPIAANMSNVAPGTGGDHIPEPMGHMVGPLCNNAWGEHLLHAIAVLAFGKQPFVPDNVAINGDFIRAVPSGEHTVRI